MAKTTAEKIATKREQIQQLQNEEKQLIQKQKEQDRKNRTKRLCQRHGLLESMLPEIITITDEQYKTFLERAVANDYGRDKLNKIITQGAANGTDKAPTGAEQTAATPTAKPAQTANPNNPAVPAKAGGGATVQG